MTEWVLGCWSACSIKKLKLFQTAWRFLEQELDFLMIQIKSLYSKASSKSSLHWDSNALARCLLFSVRVWSILVVFKELMEFGIFPPILRFSGWYIKFWKFYFWNYDTKSHQPKIRYSRKNYWSILQDKLIKNIQQQQVKQKYDEETKKILWILR